jgi:drug/metabolite transporter (DMT)-like permease
MEIVGAVKAVLGVVGLSGDVDWLLLLLAGLTGLLSLILLVYLVRKTFAFLNPITSRPTPLFSAGLFGAFVTALLVVYGSQSGEQLLPSALIIALQVLFGTFSSAILFVAVLKWARLGLVVAVWGILCLVLCGGFVAQQIPDEALNSTVKPAMAYLSERVPYSNYFFLGMK